ncbi:hypothetical protein BDZ85DRAFT_284714 [Elsinoe ampelina]|uniref:Uncharacterized protein n=1 Tax=Elsinoe ampelina TaxID=302913 RepID=A0A6A6G4C5_9PEZI|nr:hypothetical protein BDZ85DRAFT_284714 [Elsinoe ampelina]
MFVAADVRHLINLFPPTTKPKDPSPADQSTSFASSDTNNTFSTSGIPSFIPSATHPILYPFPVLQRKLLNHLSSHGSISTSSLSSLLDVPDPTTIIRWADQQPTLSTPAARKPDLPPWQQKVVAIWFLFQARYRPTRISEAAEFFGLDAEIVEAIVKAHAETWQGVEVKGLWVTKRMWEGRRRVVSTTLGDAEKHGEKKTLEGLEGWDETVVRLLVTLALGEERGGQWELQREGCGWSFVPATGNGPSEKTGLDDLVKTYRHEFQTVGWVTIAGTGEQRAVILERLREDGDLDDTTELESDSATDSATQNKVPQDSVTLVASRKLNEASMKVLEILPDVAQAIWRDTQDKDLSFNTKVQSHITTSLQDSSISNTLLPLIELVLVSSNASKPIKEAWMSRLAILSSTSSTAFLSTVRNDLRLPLHLYTAPMALYSSDPTLAEHQTSFLYDFLRSDVLPAFFKSISTLDLPPPKDLSKELSKFKTTASEARNLDALLSVFKKFSRKTKLPDVHTPLSRAGTRSLSSRTTSRTASRSHSTALSSPASPSTEQSTTTAPAAEATTPPSLDEQAGKTDLLLARDTILSQDMKTLLKAKRPSDVLQQATWILLASVVEEPMVFISGGRDAGRMVKLFQRVASGVEDEGGGEVKDREVDEEGDEGEAMQPTREGYGERMDWVGAGRRLEGFRGKVKGGKEEGREVQGVRELAGRGWEGRRVR